MKFFIRSRCYLILLPHLLLLLMLLWTLSVPLEQIDYFSAAGRGKATAGCSNIRENLGQAQALMWGMMGLTAMLALAIAWMISRSVLMPVRSIRKTVLQACQGDLAARIPEQSGTEFKALSNELNRMMECRKQDQERLLGLNRTLSAICACRHVLMHETDERRLNQQICRIFVEIGKCRMAWIGYIKEGATDSLIPSAHAGHQNGNQRADMLCDIACRAIRNRHPAIVSDVLGESRLPALQAEAARLGYAAMISLPLSADRHMMGALTLYARNPDAFGTDEVRFLSETADDLAYGIHTIRSAGRQ